MAQAPEAFNPDGSLRDPNQQASVAALGRTVAHTLAKLHA